MRSTKFFLLALLAACGGSQPTTSDARSADHDEPSAGEPVGRAVGPIRDVTPPVGVTLSEGRCGGLAELGASAPFSLLGGRLSVPGVAGTRDLARPTSIMSAEPDAAIETRLFLQSGDDKVVVFSEELFQRAGDDLLGAVQAQHGSTHHVSLLAGRPTTTVIAIPRQLDTSTEAVQVLMLLTQTSDGLVQRTAFYANPPAATAGGCERLALALASDVAAGPRTIVPRAGACLLEPGLGITLPDGFVVTAEEGHDFVVHRVHRLAPFGTYEGSLGVYSGQHPHDPDGGTPVPGTLFGQAMTWQDGGEDGAHSREALVEGPGSWLHVFFGAPEVASFDRLAAVVDTLTTSPAAGIPACAERRAHHEH